MKLLFNLNTSWNVYNFRKELILKLLESGYTVCVLAPNDSYTKKIEALGVNCFDIKINHNGINPIADLQLIRRYFQVFKTIQPDLILSYTIKPNIYGNLAARILQIPVINNISGLGTLFIKPNLISYIGKLLYKLSLKFSSHVFFQNHDDQKLFIKFKLVENSKCSVIPGSGINTLFFNSKRVTNAARRFLFVGRILKDKGVLEFLNAALNVLKSHPTIEFFIVGEIGYKNNTALQQQDLDYYLKSTPQIKYLGKSDDIKSLLDSVDVMVLPSYREGLSKSLLEAAAMKLPIITTDVVGCRDVVEHGLNGFLCQAKSISSLEKVILDMINLSSKTRHSMGVKGRFKVIKEFSSRIVINMYLEQIKKIKSL